MSSDSGNSDEKRPATKSFTAFSSAAEEAQVKVERQERDDAGHRSSAAGLIAFFPSANLPYVVTLTHDRGEPTAHGFATMREAEAFIRHKTPAIAAGLSTTYDRPAEEAQIAGDRGASEEDVLARLEELERGLRRVSPDEAVSVLASGLARAGLTLQDRLHIAVEFQRRLDELSVGQEVEVG